MIPGGKVQDGNFQVSDLSDAEVEAMLKLPPRFSLAFQALYESFLEPHWVAASQSSMVDRQRKQISFQIHVSISINTFFPDSGHFVVLS